MKRKATECFPQQKLIRRGFTVLETLLTLSLTVVVMGLLALAVDVHLRVADSSRNEVETSQSARLLLRQMANDLRNAIPVAQTPSPLGCLQGNRGELQVEISRMPLPEGPPPPAEFGDAAMLGFPQSDVRTVSYFVAKAGDLRSSDAVDSEGPLQGLIRREWERATFAWSGQQTTTDGSRRALKVLSPQVDAIEFTYLDGGTSYQEWDSSKEGRLPSAVKITISIRRPLSKRRRSAENETIDGGPTTVYSALVDLPNARVTLDQALAAAASSMEQSAPATPQENKSSDSSSEEGKSQDKGVQEVKPLSPISGGTGQ